MTLTHIRIVDISAVIDASDVVRDAQFSEADFQFDDAQHTARLDLWTPDESLSSIQCSGPFHICRVSPLRKFELTFSFAQQARFVRQSSGTGNHCLGAIGWDNRHTVKIESYDGLVIELTVTVLDGSLRATDVVDWDRAHRCRSFSFAWCKQKRRHH